MATSYRYQLFDSEFGPVSFKELVTLVREETLGTDDLVQPDWSSDWQPAATVVGLFHMAGRKDVLLHWEQEQANHTQPAPEQLLVDVLTPQSETPAWQKRLQEVAEHQRIAEALEREERHIAQMARQEAELKESVIAEALTQADRKEELRSPSRWCRWGKIQNLLTLKNCLRWGTAVAAANLTAAAILNWSTVQLQRYPNLKLLQSGAKVFPFLGTCSIVEFQFLLIDTMLVVGVLAYLGSGILVALADE